MKLKTARHFARLNKKKDRRVRKSSHGVYPSALVLQMHELHVRTRKPCIAECPCRRQRR